MTPTPQKSPLEIGLHIARAINLVHPAANIEYWSKYIAEYVQDERTAYNAILDKVQVIESACETYKNANGRLIKLCEALQKRVDSEYDRGIEDAAKASKNFICLHSHEPMCLVDSHKKLIAEAILKLRRVS